ncbi:response regulator [Paractinoplanes brasiliensis]|uniref:LuxR family two component transcriptional regulator n=1 Tax=Paractinoplanes brasiliensis TaxID=52695 RepID=A0A4R6K4X7_9ACTN|nr:response regulator transcription factor [Actinoplanes brasiliensis]TDO42285.1 LuxR family two component transcriptional regulator [Actinoplanes brasiliensis]
MTEQIRVLIVDDQDLVREGLTLILSGPPDIAVVGTAADGDEAVAAALELRPDVVLMDVRMPGMDGVAATASICARTSARVLMLTTYDLDEHVYAALRAGATGFLLKTVRGPDLVAGVRTVAAGDGLLAPSVTRRLIADIAVRPAPPSAGEVACLTARETDMLRAVARGLSNAEIAAELHITENTVKTHISNVLAKLGLRDRVQAVVLAYETGLVVSGRPHPAG